MEEFNVGGPGSAFHKVETDEKGRKMHSMNRFGGMSGGVGWNPAPTMGMMGSGMNTGMNSALMGSQMNSGLGSFRGLNALNGGGGRFAIAGGGLCGGMGISGMGIGGTGQGMNMGCMNGMNMMPITGGGWSPSNQNPWANRSAGGMMGAIPQWKPSTGNPFMGNDMMNRQWLPSSRTDPFMNSSSMPKFVGGGPATPIPTCLLNGAVRPSTPFPNYFGGMKRCDYNNMMRSMGNLASECRPNNHWSQARMRSRARSYSPQYFNGYSRRGQGGFGGYPTKPPYPRMPDQSYAMKPSKHRRHNRNPCGNNGSNFVNDNFQVMYNPGDNSDY
ncbi:hypothetical protein ACOME3_003966 [Neoechinorhynchus agilis]